MTATYDCIASNTLGSAAASVTFSSISGSFTDLIVVQTFPNNEVYGVTRFRFNSDSGNNYNQTYFYEYNGVASGRSSNASSISFATSTYMSNGVAITHIQNYSNTTTNKTVISRANFGETNGPPREVFVGAGLWRSTSAITSIELSINSGTYAAGSTFKLFGIKAE